VSIASTHISLAQIVDLIEGRLAVADQVQAQSHMVACARCAAEGARLMRVIELMRADIGEDAPPDVATRAVDLFRSRRAPVSAGPRQRLSAALRFDSGRTPQPLGVRAGVPSDRQLLFDADQTAVDLRIIQAGELWGVIGQVLGRDLNGQVDLLGAAATAQAVLNELGEFRLPPVPPGIYTLTVRLANADIEVAELEVGT
jgi:anti-sigma factor RsiW